MERLADVPKQALDLMGVALGIASGLDLMRPLEVPAAPVPSAELAELLDRRQPVSVPDHMGAEFAMYDAARNRRQQARSENERRLGVVLWAEQYLREHGQPEHQLVRDFNRRCWGVADEASADVAVRWAQTRSAL